MCSNGTDAWNSIRLDKPNIALLDNSLPHMIGLDVAEQAKKKDCPLK